MSKPNVLRRVGAYVHRVSKEVVSLAISITEKSGLLHWGEKNDLPLVLTSWIYRSGTASGCVERLSQFIEADGFQNPDSAKVVVNLATGETADDLLVDLAPQSSIWVAAGLKIFFNTTGDIGRVEAVDWRTMRRREDGTWVYNEYWGNKKLYKKKNDQVLSLFDTKWKPEQRVAALTQQINRNKDLGCVDASGQGLQTGFIVYDFQKSFVEFGDKYPMPRAAGAIEDIKSDALISELECSNIEDGWSPTMVVETPPIDDETPDENGLTDKAKFNSVIKTELTGVKGRKVLHLESELMSEGGGEIRPRVYGISKKDSYDATERAEPRIAAKVTRLFGVPKFLIGLGENGKLGNSEEIINELKVFALTVNPRQRMITRVFKKVWPEHDWEITTLKLIEHIPDQLLSMLSKEELAALAEITLPEVTTQPNGTSTEG